MFRVTCLIGLVTVPILGAKIDFQLGEDEDAVPVDEESRIHDLYVGIRQAKRYKNPLISVNGLIKRCGDRSTIKGLMKELVKYSQLKGEANPGSWWHPSYDTTDETYWGGLQTDGNVEK